MPSSACKKNEGGSAARSKIGAGIDVARTTARTTRAQPGVERRPGGAGDGYWQGVCDRCACDKAGAIVFFFFNDTATTEIYTLSLHDALPISQISHGGRGVGVGEAVVGAAGVRG